MRVFAEVAAAPMLLISNKGTSPFDDLDFEWPRQKEPPYRTRPGAPTEVNADIKEAVLARLSRRRLQSIA